MGNLEAIEAIKQLKGRYFYHLDRKEWAEWENVFTPDVILDVSGEYPDAPDPSQYIIHGAKAVVAMVAPALEGTVTVHHGHTPLITIENEDTARGIWAMEDNLFRPDGSRMTGYGHYTEQYRRIGEDWRIAKSTLSRLRLVFLPA